MTRQIVIVIDVRALCLLFALVLVLGWVEGYRRRGELQQIEAQNARIIQLLDGAQITREQSNVSRSVPL